MSDGVVRNENVSLHFTRRYGPGELLVFIHGLTDSSRCFSRVIRALSSYYDVVTYDLRGHGLSDASDISNSISDHTDDLLHLTRHLNLNDFVLIGHSLGAEVAINFQQLAAERVRSVVLIDPPWHEDWFGAPNERRRRLVSSWREWLSYLQQLPLEQVLAQGYENMPSWHQEDVLNWATAKKEFRLNALDNVLKLRPSYQDVVKNISRPTLLVTGECRRGALVTREIARKAQQIAPLLDVTFIENAGHGIYRDEFESFVSELKRFLRKY